MKYAVLTFGCILMSAMLLTACNTVKGAAEGAGKDYQATKNALTSSPRHKHKKATNQSSHHTTENTDETNETY